MKIICLIGDPVERSLSPVMHNAAFKAIGIGGEFEYVKKRVPRDELQGFFERMRNGEFFGANVTMPHKESAIPFLDGLTDDAKHMGAVNTIYKSGGRLIGHNTDGSGCIKALEGAGVRVRGKKIVLLGAGGAAKAIAFALAMNGAKEISIFNRTSRRAEELAEKIAAAARAAVSSVQFENLKNRIAGADILINATSVGMAGISENKSPVPSDFLHKKLVVNDIVHHPLKTKLLADAEKAGAKTVNGIEMLVCQAAEASEKWTGRKAPVEIMKAAMLRCIDENHD